MITVRPETPADHEAVHDLHALASGSPDKGALVAAVRAEARPPISLVAVQEDEIVGHVILSPVRMESEKDTAAALLLGPLALGPDHRGEGTEEKLVRAALDESRSAGHSVVFVVGDATLYGSLGFEPAVPKGLRSEYESMNSNLMVMELKPGALGGRTGILRYPSRTFVM